MIGRYIDEEDDICYLSSAFLRREREEKEWNRRGNLEETLDPNFVIPPIILQREQENVARLREEQGLPTMHKQHSTSSRGITGAERRAGKTPLPRGFAAGTLAHTFQDVREGAAQVQREERAAAAAAADGGYGGNGGAGKGRPKKRAAAAAATPAQIASVQGRLYNSFVLIQHGAVLKGNKQVVTPVAPAAEQNWGQGRSADELQMATLSYYKAALKSGLSDELLARQLLNMGHEDCRPRPRGGNGTYPELLFLARKVRPSALRIMLISTITHPSPLVARSTPPPLPTSAFSRRRHSTTDIFTNL